ncbi:MAG TPA: DUF2442 domain-containing protein [Myxococcota bacterium]|nr:DUF2442 domain-containing protein [Myxococcota bacterium]
MSPSDTVRGKSISSVEVTNVSKQGFWVLVGERELFASFEDFPPFREAPVGHILNVEHPSAHHLHWPDLDVDLSIDSLENPAAFPLMSRAPLEKPRRSPARKARRKRS